MSDDDALDLQLAPQRGFLVLQRANGGQQLTSLETGESVRLAAAGAPWELNFDDVGCAFVSSGDVSTWCADLLEQPAYVDESGGGRCIVDAEGHMLLLSALCKRRLCTMVSLSEGRRALADLPVIVMGLPQDGMSVWWGVPHIHKQLGLDAQNGRSHRWCEHGWARWAAFVEKQMRLPAIHMRKKWHGDVAQEELGGENLAEFRSASTCAVLSLMVRWAALRPEKGGLGQQGDRDRARKLLEAMLAKFLPQAPDKITVFIDEGCEWQGAPWPQGVRPVDFTVADGAIDLGPLASSTCRLCKSLVAEMAKRGMSFRKPVPLMDLLINGMIASGGGQGVAAHFWLVKQVLWWLGRVVDRACLLAVRAMKEPPKIPQTATSRQKDLLRYWLASREAFAHAGVVHVALDASTLAEKSTTAGLVALPDNRAVVFPPQVGRAHLSDIWLAKQWREEGEVASARADWVSKAQKFLQQKGGLEQPSEASKPRKIRKKAAQWCGTLHAVLDKVTEHGLDHFKQAPSEPDRNPDASTWPYLGVCPDQGSDGLCGSAFLIFGQNVNIEMFFDHSHGVWRDQEVAVRAVGLTGWVHLLVVLFNLAHGPFNSASKYHELRESTDDYLRERRLDCPLFQHFLVDLASDYQLEDHMHDPELPSIVAQRMAEDWHGQHKGTSVKLCRFANWVDRGRQFDESWVFQVLRILFFGLSQGLFSQSSLLATLEPAKISPAEAGAAGEEQRVGVAASNEPVRKFRAANKSNLQCAAALVMDPMCRPRLRLLYMGVAPIRKWYGQQSKTIRSSHEMRDWMLKQVGGLLQEPLRKTMAMLGDTELLSGMGLTFQFHAGDLQEDALHPAVAIQNELAALCGVYLFSLVFHRGVRTLYLDLGWTGRQALFLHGDNATRDQCAADLLQEHRAFEAASQQNAPFWRKVCSRSVFKLVPTQQLVSILKAEGGQVGPKLVGHVRDRLSGVGQSKVAEDAMCLGRRREKKASNKIQQPPRELWHSFIDKGLVDKVFRYTSPGWKSMVLPADSRNKVPEAMFHTSFKDAPEWIRHITNPAKKSEWFSPSAELSNASCVDILLMKEAFDGNKWESIAKDSFMACLCNGINLAVCPPKSRAWYFSVGVVCGTGVALWPAQATWSGQKLTQLAPAPDGRIEVRIVTDMRRWRAVSYEWHCPWSQVLRGWTAASEAERAPTIKAIVSTPARALIEEAAAQAFWSLPMTTLALLARSLGVVCRPGGTLTQRIEALVMAVFPKMSPDGLLAILAKRVQGISFWDDFLALDDMEDLVDEKDREEFGRTQAGAQAKARAKKAMVEQYVEAAQRLKPSSGSRSGSSSSNRGPRIFNSVAGNRCGGRFPDGEGVTSAEAQALAPDPVRMYSDDKNGRWQAFYPGLGTRSRSWALYGNNASLKLCLQWAWQQVLWRHGMQTAECPIRGLFSAAES